MRAVSFSDPRVRNQLNQQFVCTFTNTEGDPTAGQSIAHRPGDPPGGCIRGNGKQNVQSIFMTPHGEIYHVATGFLSEDDLSQEIQFAANLFDEIQKRPEMSRQVVVEGHRARLAQLGFSDAEIDSQNGFEMFMGMGMEMPGMTGGAINGSGSRGSGGFDPFAGFVRAQMLSDNKFPIRNPLMDWRSLESNPATLVGSGKSFFASSSSGGNR